RGRRSRPRAAARTSVPPPPAPRAARRGAASTPATRASSPFSHPLRAPLHDRGVDGGTLEQAIDPPHHHLFVVGKPFAHLHEARRAHAEPHFAPRRLAVGDDPDEGAARGGSDG